MWGWQGLGRAWVEEKQMEQTPSEEGALPSAERANEPGSHAPADSTRVTGLDAETATPVPEMAPTVDVGESSVYRLGQRRPATRRSTETPPRAPQAEPDTSTRRAAMDRFRIRFLAERVVRARDIRDALRQARSIRAIEVIAVTRQE